jgi:hypothetical protein
MKARVSNLHKTEAEWAKLNNWKPEAGELVVYDTDDTFNYPRVKLGDGEHSLSELPFFIDQAALSLVEKLTNTEKILDAGRITAYKK